MHERNEFYITKIQTPLIPSKFFRTESQWKSRRRCSWHTSLKNSLSNNFPKLTDPLLVKIQPSRRKIRVGAITSRDWAALTIHSIYSREIRPTRGSTVQIFGRKAKRERREERWPSRRKRRGRAATAADGAEGPARTKKEEAPENDAPDNAGEKKSDAARTIILCVSSLDAGYIFSLYGNSRRRGGSPCYFCSGLYTPVGWLLNMRVNELWHTDIHSRQYTVSIAGLMSEGKNVCNGALDRNSDKRAARKNDKCDNVTLQLVTINKVFLVSHETSVSANIRINEPRNKVFDK